MSSATSVAELRERASLARQAASRLTEEADNLDKYASEFESNLNRVDSLLNTLGDLSSVAATNGEHKRPGRPAGSKNKTTKAGKKTGKPGRPAGSKNKTKASDEEAQNKTSLKDLILQILKERKGGLDLKSIVKECITRGYKSKTMNPGSTIKFSQIVSTNLYNMTSKEHSVKRDNDKDSKNYKKYSLAA